MGRRKKGLPINGWVVVDKPPGIGSTPVVNAVKRHFNAQKAGHGGTLDPFASGILPIALGEATKTMSFVMDGTKTYEFTIRWGVETDTLDIDGEVTRESGVRPGRDAILAALDGFIGEIEQVPPAFSAIKVDGRRAYDMARNGEAVELQPRVVEILSLELLDMPDADHAVLRMSCGKGTYVRSFGRDLAEALGTVSHLAQLRRIRVGPFGDDKAVPYSQFSLEQQAESDHNPAQSGALLPLEAALDGIPALSLTESEAMRLRNGQPVSLLKKMDLDRVRDVEPGDIVLAMVAGKALALARFERGEIQPVRVFNVK